MPSIGVYKKYRYLINLIINRGIKATVFSQTSNDLLGVAFGLNGLKMYVMSEVNAAIYEYDLTDPYDVESATYNSVSLDLSSQTTVLRGLAISSDGTKIYTLNDDSPDDEVLQYVMSTPFDLSTATYDDSFNVASQTGAPVGVSFNGDGTKMYVIAVNGPTYQYSLSTAWDVTSATYDSVSFATSGQSTAPRALVFNNNGSKCYFWLQGASTIYQYSLSTAYDLSTASYDSINSGTLSAFAGGGDGVGMAFDDTGRRIFVTQQANADVVEFITGFAVP